MKYKSIYQNDAHLSSKNKPKFNGVYSRNNLPKIKYDTYVINLDEYQSIGTHWVRLYVNSDNVTLFDSFGVEHIPKEIRKLIKNKNITPNIYRIQAYHSIMCGYFRIWFIDFTLKGKSLLEYTNLLSLNDYENNDKIVLKYFE